MAQPVTVVLVRPAECRQAPPVRATTFSCGVATLTNGLKVTLYTHGSLPEPGVRDADTDADASLQSLDCRQPISGDGRALWFCPG